MLILFADNISRSLQARLSRRRRAYRAVMTFPLEGQTTKTKTQKLTNSNLEMAVGRRRATLNLRAIEVTEIVSKVAGNKKRIKCRQACEHESGFDSESANQEKHMRQLSASQSTISIMLILFAVNISRSLQARLWRRRRAHTGL